MKRKSIILQMKVLGALDNAPGKTMKERYQKVADMVFTDEHGNTHQFTSCFASVQPHQKRQGVERCRQCREDQEHQLAGLMATNGTCIQVFEALRPQGSALRGSRAQSR